MTFIPLWMFHRLPELVDECMWSGRVGAHMVKMNDSVECREYSNLFVGVENTNGDLSDYYILGLRYCITLPLTYFFI
jgi:hypothetical protein